MASLGLHGCLEDVESWTPGLSDRGQSSQGGRGFQAEQVACAWMVTRMRGTRKHPCKGGRKAGLGERGLVLGAPRGYSADVDVDFSMVTGVTFKRKGGSWFHTDVVLAQRRNF